MSRPCGLWISQVPEVLALPNFVARFSGAIKHVYIKQLAYTLIGIIRTQSLV